MAGSIAEDLLELLGRLIVVTQVEISDSEIEGDFHDVVERCAFLGSQSQVAAEELDGLIECLILEEEVAEVTARLGMRGIEVEGALEIVFRSFGLAAIPGDDREVIEAIGLEVRRRWKQQPEVEGIRGKFRRCMSQ